MHAESTGEPDPGHKAIPGNSVPQPEPRPLQDHDRIAGIHVY